MFGSKLKITITGDDFEGVVSKVLVFRPPF